MMTDPEFQTAEELRKNLKQALMLLSLARCPNAHCVDGVIQEGFADDYEVFQCQWCDEKRQLAEGR